MQQTITPEGYCHYTLAFEELELTPRKIGEAMGYSAHEVPPQVIHEIEQVWEEGPGALSHSSHGAAGYGV